MTDVNPEPKGVDNLEDGSGAGVKRPDQEVGGPASGGEGAAGAGGPDGFGTGT